MIFSKFCLSSYLTFRYVVRENISWVDEIIPSFPEIIPSFPKMTQSERYHVKDSKQILKILYQLLEPIYEDKNTGILLSGGIDSAILAALLPENSNAYTIKFISENSLDESIQAKIYAKRYRLKHHVVEVMWDDYLEYMDNLMLNKKSPLHPVEVGLFKTASKAAEDGIDTLIIGNGADSTFGGMDKLLSKDWRFDDFVKRYTFVDPSFVLQKPVSMLPVYEEYKDGDRFDVVKFLKVTHGLGIIQAFDNALIAAGVKSIEPYEKLVLDVPLDLARIRNGESKYLLRDIFMQLYPGVAIPEKIPFARPMENWMKNWAGPQRSEFMRDIDIKTFNGEQKWLIFGLERFLDLMEKNYGNKN
jgi:asparagine synthetase B (glutamine-hydrolysing)